MAFENITPKIEEIVRASGVREGFVLCNAMHITASVFINDDESGLHEDYKKWLETLAPFDASPKRYAHNRTGEDNADAHMKRQIMGREVLVAITNGKLDLVRGNKSLRRIRRTTPQTCLGQSDRRVGIKWNQPSKRPEELDDLLGVTPRFPGAGSETQRIQGFTNLHVRFALISELSRFFCYDFIQRS